MTKQTGIVDRFEGDSVVVEVNGEMVNFDRADAPAMLCEGKAGSPEHTSSGGRMAPGSMGLTRVLVIDAAFSGL